ncbi:hypothetical protein Phum_PHUM578390 [Pediculus humanus corporis]|uniref:Uncharacterized protein n=1 Tax=Pediculus humanus subsp. corporis TaxID=121224 RepID=E0W1K2_PEDHC|nr:uncharacterized protein Phum_PHUM578390 [Pediculus humanus corporis]EEB19508.1 hypothetical protein Phum_PHUM578390 [Pediculus humanus corporis]
MIRPRATRALAINGLTITATISRDDETIFKKCGQNLQTFNGTVKEEEEDCKYHVTGEDESLEWEKWKKRREHYDKKKTNGNNNNKEKTLENSKDSLDLMYEKKKMGMMGKSSSVDFPIGGKECLKIQDNGEKIDEVHKKNGNDKPEKEIGVFDTDVQVIRESCIPRSVSDILDIEKKKMKKNEKKEKKIKKYPEMDLTLKTGNKFTKKSESFHHLTLLPSTKKKKKNFPIDNGNDNVNDDDNNDNNYEYCTKRKKNIKCLEYESIVYVDFKYGDNVISGGNGGGGGGNKKCNKTGNDKDNKLFRNYRSRSATIPRKWSEYSLSTPSTTSEFFKKKKWRENE